LDPDPDYHQNLIVYSFPTGNHFRMFAYTEIEHGILWG